MDLFLGKVTQQAMNYAIRSGITITSTYAIRQCSRLLKTVEGDQGEELSMLQDQLDSKIKIISPAIDMIELISARGNTSLESAVTLTKSLRWEIQSLGVRLAKAANAEELSRQSGSRAKSNSPNDLELRRIIAEIKKLLKRIEDAVPLINLAISTSGASLSTNLPATVSPSRLLQSSTFLTAGDTQFSMQPDQAVQIGPAFTLSLYMLFSGHAFRPQDEEGTMREMTWKEVIHKARVKLYRVPLEKTYDLPQQNEYAPEQEPAKGDGAGNPSPSPSARSVEDRFISHIAGDARADEFAYQLLIVEDLNDDRVHSFEEDEPQPGPFEDVEIAGIREVVPIHEISKIFYADTGKILNIGNEGEVNSSVLLLKRDVNAAPPRKMMERAHRERAWLDDDSLFEEQEQNSVADGTQYEINNQLSREERASSLPVQEESPPLYHDPWKLPADLDPEWLAFEVYTEQSDSDDEDVATEMESPSLQQPSRSARESSMGPNLDAAFSSLSIATTGTPKSSSVSSHSTPQTQSAKSKQHRQLIQPSSLPVFANSTFNSTAGPIRTSLSLLETLIRLTSLQQFQQTSHLSITDELLNFFLSESSTTGAGGDGEERRRKRWEARRKVGFDPYDESPVKLRGENGAAAQAQSQPPQAPEYYDQDVDGRYSSSSARNSPQLPSHRYRHRHLSPSSRSSPNPASPPSSPMNLRSRDSLERGTPHVPRPSPLRSPLPGRDTGPSTPGSAKGRQAALRRQGPEAARKESPLGRRPADRDSSLGTSPGHTGDQPGGLGE
ncbi:MAG: hypothetical protein M1837_001599 [Sclerophora amabilis]|nr:MAG: hypothetical protein M1837_001599 [Sclerophora amabilis]